MGIILCATRGGEPSSRTEQKAIALAKERGDTLLFLYIVNTHFLDKTAAPIVVDVDDELSDMGEFLLLMARERAENQGVDTETMIRKGDVRAEIKNVALEVGATMVVLGKPVGQENVFKMENLKAFASEIESETGAEAIIV
jgi:nucleotide-binding universal stress UspA family protein